MGLRVVDVNPVYQPTGDMGILANSVTLSLNESKQDIITMREFECINIVETLERHRVTLNL